MMRLDVIASTLDTMHYPDNNDPRRGRIDHVYEADALAEYAGRACYQSWARPNPATATNAGYLANILDHGHHSVLEHASVTLYVQGVSRALTHELVRHRHFSFSQLSQRFVDESAVTFVIPPAIRDAHVRAGMTVAEAEQSWNDMAVFEHVREEYKTLSASAAYHDAATRKEIREAARSVLPNCTETKIVITGNIRTWREFILKRDADGVDAEMRELAQAACELIRKHAPNSMQDMI